MDKILVTGANGHYGRAVLTALLNNGSGKRNIYAMVRDKTKAAELQSLGIHVVFGDYEDYDSLLKAFSGIDKLLFVSGSDSKNQITQTIPIAQLTIHHTQQLVPAGEMPNTIISFVTTDYRVKGSLRKKGTHL